MDTNEIGELAELFAKEHFKSIGYSIDEIGIEKIAPNYCKGLIQEGNNFIKHIEMYFQNIPDFIITKTQNDKHFSSVIEVKYRSNIQSFKDLRLELFWNYRHHIWNKDFYSFIEDESLLKVWNTDIKYFDLELKDSFKQLFQRYVEYADKMSYMRIPIIFYVLTKKCEDTKKDFSSHLYLTTSWSPQFYGVSESDKSFFHKEMLYGKEQFYPTYKNLIEDKKFSILFKEEQ